MMKPDDDWDESVFNDPRQIVMDLPSRPEDDFDSFHRNNPEVWRKFRKLVLEKFNSGERDLCVASIMRQATSGATLRTEIVDKYWNLFISNHQELENVFKLSPAPEAGSK